MERQTSAIFRLREGMAGAWFFISTTLGVLDGVLPAKNLFCRISPETAIPFWAADFDEPRFAPEVLCQYHINEY